MMRRSEIKRGTSQLKRSPMTRSREKKGPGLAQRIADSLGRAINHAHSEPSVFRSRQHRQNVAALPCVYCGLEKNSQAAHLNLSALGKGLGLKVSDALTIPLCCTRLGQIGCHVRLDSSGQYDKATSEALQLTWMHKTRNTLTALGHWPEQAEADMIHVVGAYLKRAA
ncbi:hypothetical protein [Eoetvoesiella caeni]|uniref:Uncharacterized protein n=1 Tax=Eoetvoesiella caeni TaxID=645616 RepID=A0A366HC96_9BURK|nr:hypothetical protein [Eoetvoesiella caeni]MCI2809367.1 hypothetical protein [Eoetvoesiella caeni]NYT54508.1 hypothetical protein [Eoetvoesiella caeni]RBP39303.1 hypothetical protein DFR37_10595 [Eoetvoesiella caeni]